MKKLLQLGAIFCGILVSQLTYAADGSMGGNYGNSMGGNYGSGMSGNYGSSMSGNYGSSMSGGNSGSYGSSMGSSGNHGSNYGSGNYGGGSYGGNYGGGSYSGNYGAQGGGCPEDHPCEDQPIQSECWVKYVHYEPCYYTTQRCVEEQVPCKRRCCRYVDQQYEVTKCRYVPQYYCETACRKVPEYYDVEECKTCKKYIPEQHCTYKTRCYWKHVCGQPNCTNPCPK